MFKITAFTGMLVLMFCTQLLKGQNVRDSVKIDSLTYKIEQLNEEKEQIIRIEKEKLKETVKHIIDKEEKGEITEEEAQNQKEEVAKQAALNIENKTAIVDNRIELIQRGEEYHFYEWGDSLKLNTGSQIVKFSVSPFGKTLFGFDIEEKNKKPQFDKRTYSDLFLAFGLNNTITEGQSFDDSPYKIGGSRFFEVGLLWSTRVFKESNILRFRYGFSFQFNGLKPKDNMYLVENGNETFLEEFPENLDKSKFRMDNLVFPVFFEFGPSDKIEKDDHFRYSTENKFKIGVGGYAGFNMSTRQKLKFDQDGDAVKQKIKSDYNTNNFIYGLAAYMGVEDTSFYIKYDLNPIFSHAGTDQRNISLGVRFDL